MKMYVKDRATKVPRCENYGWFGMYSTRQLKHIGYILYSGKLLREKTFMKTFRGENFHRILSHAIVYWVWYTQNFHGGNFHRWLSKCGICESYSPSKVSSYTVALGCDSILLMYLINHVQPEVSCHRFESGCSVECLQPNGL